MKCFKWNFMLLILVGAISSGRADPFADAVISVNYGSYAGFGQDQLPGIVLGPPEGAGTGAGSTDVLSLGDGGDITLMFTDNEVVNGPGPDLIVFENAMYVNGDPESVFCEVAYVEVSQDGVQFIRFPNDYNPDGTPPLNPANWTGFAGVYPVLSNSSNGIDPTDPSVAGGDPFDLDDVGLDWVKYIRIIDTNEPPNAGFDDDGDEIYDAGVITAQKSGFDLDAVVAVHSRELSTPTPEQTVTPIETATPEPTFTATETPVITVPPTPEPTGTTPPSEFQIQVVLSREYFEAGDRFQVKLDLWSPAVEPRFAWVYLVLDAGGEYFFWPAWSEDGTGLMMEFRYGATPVDILDFPWPENVQGHGSLAFWAAILDTRQVLISNLDFVGFGY